MKNDILEQRKRVQNNVLKSFGGSDDLEKAKNKHYFSTEEREKLSEKDEALPDGSFPIRNSQDLKDAIRSVGRAKDPERAKRWIKRRARELGKEDLLPDTWKAENYEILDFEEIDLQKAEQLLLGDDVEVDLFEKAHVHGEVHPNGKWYWDSKASGGKGDWRVIKKKEGKTEENKKEIEKPTVEEPKKLSDFVDPVKKNDSLRLATVKKIAKEVIGKDIKDSEIISKIIKEANVSDKIAYKWLNDVKLYSYAAENRYKRYLESNKDNTSSDKGSKEESKTKKQKPVEKESDISLNDFPVLKVQDTCKKIILDSTKKIKGIYDNFVKNDEIESYDLQVLPHNLGYNLQVTPKNKKVFDKEKNKEKIGHFDSLFLSVEPDVFINNDFSKNVESKINLYISGIGGAIPSMYKIIPISKDKIDDAYNAIKKEIDSYFKNFKLLP